jgi:hypothetical protein
MMFAARECYCRGYFRWYYTSMKHYAVHGLLSFCVTFRNLQKGTRGGSQRLYLLKNGVFWDVMPCVTCKNRRFGGT